MGFRASRFRNTSFNEVGLTIRTTINVRRLSCGVEDAHQTDPRVPTHEDARHGTGPGPPPIGVVGRMHASDLGDSRPSQSPTGDIRLAEAPRLSGVVLVLVRHFFLRMVSSSTPHADGGTRFR